MRKSNGGKDSQNNETTDENCSSMRVRDRKRIKKWEIKKKKNRREWKYEKVMEEKRV